MPVKIGGVRPRRRIFFKEWREAKGLTQEQMAKRLNTTKGGISRLETGHSMYSQASLEAWADALFINPATLISRPPTEDERVPRIDTSSLTEAQLRMLAEVLKTIRG